MMSIFNPEYAKKNLSKMLGSRKMTKIEYGGDGGMIFTYRPFGRLGNRLFLFSRSIAFSEYSGIPIINWAFSEYSRDFPYFRKMVPCFFGHGPSPLPESNRSLFMLKLLGKAGLVPTVRFWDNRDIVFDGKDSLDPRIEIMKRNKRVIFEG